MDSRRAEEIMQSYGVIDVTYNGMPVWIEGVRKDFAEVTLVEQKRRLDVPVSALAEAGPMQTM